MCSGTPATPSMPAPSTPGLQPPTPDVKPPIPETPKEDIKPLPFPFEKEPETKVNLKHAEPFPNNYVTNKSCRYCRYVCDTYNFRVK